MDGAKPYRIVGNIWVKTVAVILLCIFGVGVLLGGTGAFFAANNYFFDVDPNTSYYESTQCSGAVRDAADFITYNYVNGADSENTFNYNPDSSNIVYDLYRIDEATMKETLVSSNYRAPIYGYSADYYAQIYIQTVETGALVKEVNLYSDKTFISAEGNNEAYHIKIGVADPLEAYDSFWRSAKVFEYSAKYQPYILPVLSISSVLFLADVFFLAFAAGRKAGKEEVELNWFDRIPFDVLAVIIGAVIFGIAILILDAAQTWIPWNFFTGGLAFTLTVIGIVGVLCVVGLLLLSLFMTFMSRVKAGKWWRNTWIWMIGNALMRFIEAIPSVWQVTLAAFIYVGLTLFFIDERWWVFLTVMNAVCAMAAVIYAYLHKRVREGAARMAGGNLDSMVNTEYMFGPVKKEAEDLNSIREGMRVAVDTKMKSERLKTELITNVSHDIKTPLTSIINYVDLLQKEPDEKEKEVYMERLSRNANRLKKLTEDLIEASKASTGNIAVHKEELDLTEIVEQALAEYDEKWEAKNLEAVLKMNPGLKVYADGRLLWRVFSNLFSNIAKYAQDGTRIYIDAKSGEDGYTSVVIKNISHDPLNIDAEELLERFVRADSSRHTEGSGLGLNIAKSLMELQGGDLALSIDGDLFRADIRIAPEEDVKQPEV